MNDFYAEELAALRKDAAAYARKYPATAPMLAEPGSDPDVERVLEGTAFLCARIRERLQRNAPRLLQDLLRWSFPQALLPLPSTAMIRFWPQPGVSEALHVAAGAQLAARPVAGVSCIYSTDHPLTVSPVQIAAVRTEPGTPWLKVAVRFDGNPLAGLPADEPLTLFLAGAFDEAAQRFFVLLRQLDHLEVRTGRLTRTLPAASVSARHFPLTDPRMPPQRKRNHAYMEVIRYLYMPTQLLCLGIDGLHRGAGQTPGEALEIVFCLRPPFERVPHFDRESFALGVVPASNVFPTFADPITVDHTQLEYPLHPQDAVAKKLEILSVAGVTGLFPGGRMEIYHSCEYRRAGGSPYVYGFRFTLREDGGAPLYHLMPLYADRAGGVGALRKHVLSVSLTCCNRDAPNALGIGDICLPTDSSPAQAAFANISVPTPMQARPHEDLEYWLYLSHRSANLLPQASAELLSAMLSLYVGDDRAAPERAAARRRCCDAILEFSSEEEERLIRGHLHRGWRLKLVLDPAGFGSFGGMYLFASALERFFGGFTAINNYARLVLEVAGTGECFAWPPRMGEKQLL